MTKRALKVGLAVVLAMAIAGAVAGFIARRGSANTQLGIAESLTTTSTVEATASATFIPSDTPTATWTATPTCTATPTDTQTPTSTLSTLVLRITAINSDVTLDSALVLKPISTPTSLPTLKIPSPAAKVALLPSGEAPLVGWFTYDVQNPALQYQGKWDVFTSTYRAANHHYVYTNDDKARLLLRFLGAAVRLRYAKYFNYGVFQVRLDDQIATTIDSYHPKIASQDGDFVTTDVFDLVYGWHTLEIVSTGQKNPASGDTYIALDGIDVFLNGPAPTPIPTSLSTSPTVTPSPAPAQKIQLFAAPPTVQPTTTPAPPSVTSINFTVAYDLNSNKAVDPSEGVQGLSVRLITADTNQVIASGLTNSQGFLHLEATGNASLRLIVPYFNRFWDVPVRSSTRITLLLPSANQPGLIP